MMISDIIIVDYFKASSVVKNIEKLKNNEKFNKFNFIVWDNSVSEANWVVLQEHLGNIENVTLIKSKHNVGYTKAYNRAIKHTKSDIFIIQNPDIQVRDVESYCQLAQLIEHKANIGILGCRQENLDGTTPTTVRRFPTVLGQITKRTPFLRRFSLFAKLVSNYEDKDFDYSVECYVPWLQSSLLVIDKTNWVLLNGFDERFKIFMSDIDICLKCWLGGRDVLYTPAVTVFADGQRSSEGHILEIFRHKVVAIHALDALKYYVKYLGSSEVKKSKIYNKIKSLNNNG